MSSKGKSSAETSDGATLVPRLQFPEFQTADGWKEISLQKLAQPVTDRAIAGDAENVLSLSGERGLLLQSDYFGKKIAGDITDRYLKIRKDDFVYNDRTTKASSFGTIKRLSNYSGGIVSPIYKCFRFQPSENPAFWEWYFESGSHDPALGGLVNEGARAGRFNISVTQLLSTNAWRPDEAEQQEIAECLDSAHTLIAAQGRKVEVLKAHKKGLMQKLFPQEGETQPRLRFPDFEETGEWEEHPFDHFVSTSFYGTSNLTSPKGRYPVLRMGNMVEGSIDYSNLVYIDLDDATFDKIKLEEGDILLNRTNSPALVGKISLFQSDQECITASYIVTYRLTKSRLDASFCNAMLNTAMYQARIKKLAKRSINQANINPTSFRKELSVVVPSLKEQQRIADCLNSLDDLITAESQKLDALKTHKKGLMQQLFPQVMEE